MKLPAPLQKVWDDPVWSKVIAGVILFCLGALPTERLLRNWLLSVIVGCFLLAWGFCFWVRYRKTGKIEVPSLTGKPYRSTGAHRRWALYGIWSLPSLILLSIGFGLYLSTRPSRKIIVVVANFAGPEPENYRVTEFLLMRLREVEKRYPDIQIHALGESVSEEQGSDYAKSKGKDLKATLVLWGYYAAKEEPFILLHIEKPGRSNHLALIADEEKLDVPLGEPPSLTFRQRLPSDMAYLILYTIGLARYEANNYDGAITAFSDALEQGPAPDQLVSPAEAYFYRATAYAREKRYDSAVADYGESIKAEPTITAYYNRGLIYTKQAKYDGALEDFDQAIRLKPDDAEVYGIRGVIHWIKGDIDAAIADCNRALALSGFHEEWVAYSIRGAAHGKKHDFDDAIADFDRAIHLNSKDSATFRRRGAVYVLTGKFDLAFGDYNRAVALEPDNATLYFERGEAYSVKVLKDTTAQKSVSGGFLLNKKDFDAALANLDKSIDLRPRYAEAYDSRGFMYALVGKNQEAIADYKKVLDVSTSPSLREKAEQMLSTLPPTSEVPTGR